MSEVEKKAIEEVRQFNKDNIYRDGGKLNNAIDTVLNLVEKQQKEIERLQPKKIKVIDLLNKIANGEKVPKKLKDYNFPYVYQFICYNEEKKQFYLEGMPEQLYHFNLDDLNKELIIMEE